MIGIAVGGIVAIVLAALVIGVLLLALRQMVNIVQQGEVGVVKHLGEYRKTHEPGLVIIAPFVDSLQRVDMREIPRPGDRQDVITKDNVVVTVNATIFTQVVVAEQALFSIANFDVGIDALARTALRSVIGTMTLDQALSERENINTDVQQQMEAVTDKWGIRINRIEIIEIAPPPKILEALALQKQADQEKRARSCSRKACSSRRSTWPRATPRRPCARPRAARARRSCAPRASGRRRSSSPRVGPRRSRRSTGRSRRASPTRRWWPSCSSTRWPSSPRATTPRSSCRTSRPALLGAAQTLRSVLSAAPTANGDGQVATSQVGRRLP